MAFTDSFTGSDANPIGGNWTTMPGQNAMQRLSNAIQGSTASAENGAYVNSVTPANDQYAQAKCTTIGTGDGGPAVRMGTATENEYLIDCSSGTTPVAYKVTGGSFASIGGFSGSTFATNDVVYISATGGSTTTIIGKRNGVQQFSTTDSSSPHTSGRFGMFVYSNAQVWDDFEGGDTAITAMLSGTATASITETDIVAGGKTVILTLNGDTWISATGTWSFVASGAVGNGNNATSVSPGLPAGWAAGDLHVLVFSNYGGTNSRTPAAPSGWSTIPASTDYTQNGTTSLGVYYRIAEAGDSAPTVSLTGTGVTGDTQLSRIHGFRPSGGTISTDVLGTVSTNTSADDVGPITGITPAAGSLLLLIGAKSNDWNGTATDSGYTLATQNESTTGNDAGNALLYQLSAGGSATGNQTITDNGGTASNGVGLGVMASFKLSSPFDDQRAAIRNGLDSAQAEAAGWDAKVKPNIPVANVVRTSDTVCTITLQAQSDYDITAQETITATIPATALAGGAQIVATPTFTVDTAATGAVALTGLGATAAQTGPSVAHAQALAGLEASAAQTMPTAVHVNTGVLAGLAATPAQTMPGVLRSRALAGLEGTAQQTNPTAAHTQALAGQEAATGQGALTVARSTPVAGLEATAAFTGPSVAPRSIALTGQEATAAPGTITARSGYEAALAGLEATAAQTGPAAASAVALTGGEASAQVGDLTATTETAKAVDLTGLEATSAGGTLSALHSNALAGQEATAAAGSLVQAHTAQLAGQEAQAAAGSIGKASARAVAGLEATAAEGDTSAAQAVLLTGSQATAEAGTLTPVVPGSVVVTLDGLEAGAAAGDLGHDREHPLLGMEAVVEQGEIVLPQQTGGAAFVGWLLERIDEEPVRERIEEERRELAISKKASAVIAELARDQLARQVQGEITRTEELVRALEARKIGWKRAYDDALAAYRQIYESVQTAAVEAAEAQRQQAELAARNAEEDEIRITQLLLLNGDV